MEKGTLITEIETFIKNSNLGELNRMRDELSNELKKGLLKDRVDHSYTLELQLIEKQIYTKTNQC